MSSSEDRVGGVSVRPVMAFVPAALRLAEARGMRVPEELDQFGLRSISPSFMSSRGFRWPFPGSWAETPEPKGGFSGGECPKSDGDGLCVGLTWQGMASGQRSCDVVLLCGWRLVDELGSSADKIRSRRVYVIDVLTVGDLVREFRKADLGGANLCEANLRGATLYGANLCDANLCGAVNK